MEDEKKKRKNKKKKKNKQQAKAATEDTASNAGDTSSSEQSHVLESKDHLSRSVDSNGGVTDNGSIKIVEDKVDRNAQIMSSFVSSDIEKQNWLQEEARLSEMIKKLLYEKDLHMQRQSDLEVKIKQLQSENNSRHQKEVNLEQRISQLLQEKASLSSEEERVRHMEKEKALLLEKENSGKEMITVLSNENTRLRKQVVELEGAKNNLSQQNRQLIDNISILQSRIQDFERNLASAQSSGNVQKEVSDKEVLNAQIEASCALVEKLVAENAELVEKVNELYMELGRRNVMASVVIPDYAIVRDPVSGSGEDISSSAKSFERFEKVPFRDDQLLVSDDMDSDYAHIAWHPSGTAVSGEIVQIPLDENEAHDMEAQRLLSQENESVPLIDAPLIGAPFRLISAVARYVSGADLVNRDSSDSQQ
ncbi:hypothetical protein Cgig2_031904 [Carnegiea gigantea]|uniref:Uncharacterized protein n=1 Tax=Carnegiea gigantea TaxID=171969 RepID=A0A9Q1KSC9_9CARY|nr:hypothetical protein Cgig2_010446 [Carnegiea gigantea]KAJ8448180.1 hypothetical protein Cgig2_031904 [Carnegiea gigantea]